MTDQMSPRPIVDRGLGSNDLTWSVSAAAGQLGVAPSTLRTWDRRYGVGPAIRTVGGHRRYNGDDIARVRRMADLIAEGVSPDSAARAVQMPTDPVGG